MYTHLYATFCLEIVAIIIGFYYWTRLSVAYKIILFQVLLAFAIELTGFFLNQTEQKNNAWLYNFYMLAEMWLLGIAVRYFVKSNVLNVGIICYLLGMSLYWGVNITSKGGMLFDNKFILITSFVNIMLYLYAIANNELFKVKKIYVQPLFVLSVSLVVYFASIIPLFGLLNVLIKDNIKLADKLFYINISAVFLRYSMTAFAFYLYGRQAKKTALK